MVGRGYEPRLRFLSVPAVRTPGGYSFVGDSWIQMLHTAFAERLQFGRDVVFTFAPGDSFMGDAMLTRARQTVQEYPLARERTSFLEIGENR